tara:strand:+ start:913 stop:1557 length:645 start_codon:yes stop_codon:yes gene_type:complete
LQTLLKRLFSHNIKPPPLSKIILVCFSIFIAFYIIATFKYAGGSLSTPTASNFLWTENYFCDMMNSTSINGKKNLSRPFSIVALISLCIGITTFFIWFSNEKMRQNNYSKTLKITGNLSIFFTSLIFTTWHDQFIILAIISGIIPSVIILYAILKNINIYDIAFTLFVFTFLIGYILIYYLNIFETAHPIIQKCAVLLGLIWIIKTNFKAEDRR